MNAIEAPFWSLKFALNLIYRSNPLCKKILYIPKINY